MKRFLPIQLILIVTITIMVPRCTTRKATPESPISFREINDKTLIPEGIAVHPVTGQVFLSSLHQDKIVSVDNSGRVTDVITKGQQGFMWGLGMKFSKDGRILWACTADGNGKTALFAIDHQSHKVIRKYVHDAARFLNDLVILDDDRIFITDTEKGSLFLLQDDSLQLFLNDPQLTWANGITATPRGDLLFVASGRYGLMKINTATHAITSATGNQRTDYAIDGLVLHHQTLYGAIGWPQDSVHQHRIIRYYLDTQYNFMRADTLCMNQPWLNCPTTLAVHRGQLFSMAVTNLGIYNRHQQQTATVMDSLRLPVIAVWQLPKHE